MVAQKIFAVLHERESGAGRGNSSTEEQDRKADSGSSAKNGICVCGKRTEGRRLVAQSVQPPAAAQEPPPPLSSLIPRSTCAPEQAAAIVVMRSTCHHTQPLAAAMNTHVSRAVPSLQTLGTCPVPHMMGMPSARHVTRSSHSAATHLHGAGCSGGEGNCRGKQRGIGRYACQGNEQSSASLLRK